MMISVLDTQFNKFFVLCDVCHKCPPKTNIKNNSNGLFVLHSFSILVTNPGFYFVSKAHYDLIFDLCVCKHSVFRFHKTVYQKIIFQLVDRHQTLALDA